MPSPIQARVRDVALEALSRENGLIILFEVGPRYGDLEQTKTYARSFQRAFGSMRNKERRKAMPLGVKEHATRDTDFVGPFDGLNCSVVPMEGGRGYKVELFPGGTFDFASDVRDGATGEVLGEYSPTFTAANAVLQLILREETKAVKARVPFLNFLSPEQERAFFLGGRAVMEQLYATYGWTLPQELFGEEDAPAPPTDGQGPLTAHAPHPDDWEV